MASTKNAAASATTQHTVPIEALDWRQIPFHNLKTASRIAGLSIASLYAGARDGRLTFKKLSGRTLVETNSLLEFIESATDWAPSSRSAAAVSERLVRAAERWADR